MIEGLKKISENEYEAIDPVTGGLWRVISPHLLSPFGASIAIAQQLYEKGVRPAKGSTATVHFEIRTVVPGETPSTIPGITD
ncbi:MAG: hypothetical protein WC390_06600 [Sulfurimonas sp.]|jgi:hypothetical protein